jgi:Tfp pilus assembly protein PilZ
MSDNKRRDPRFESLQKLWCEGQTTRVAEARNMSKSGMFIVSEQPHQVGEQIKVAFEDEGGKIELKMEVMWRGEAAQGEQTGLGLKIVEFDEGGAYDRFVKRQLVAQGLDGESDADEKDE